MVSRGQVLRVKMLPLSGTGAEAKVNYKEDSSPISLFLYYVNCKHLGAEAFLCCLEDCKVSAAEW